MLAEYNSASFSTGRMNKLRQTDNLERGFTLVELMVTVAIMGVVAAFAVPNMTRQMAEGRMKSTARILESTFKEAKAESLIRRKNVTVTYTAKTATSDGTLTLSVGVGAKKKQLAEYSLDSRSSIDMTPASSVIFLIYLSLEEAFVHHEYLKHKY